jgi:hypothetical protein
MLKNYYRNFGDVRGDCGHRHRTLKGARACQAADQRYCMRQGGYTDWVIWRITPDGADIVGIEVVNG